MRWFVILLLVAGMVQINASGNFVETYIVKAAIGATVTLDISMNVRLSEKTKVEVPVLDINSGIVKGVKIDGKEEAYFMNERYYYILLGGAGKYSIEVQALANPRKEASLTLYTFMLPADRTLPVSSVEISFTLPSSAVVSLEHTTPDFSGTKILAWRMGGLFYPKSFSIGFFDGSIEGDIEVSHTIGIRLSDELIMADFITFTVRDAPRHTFFVFTEESEVFASVPVHVEKKEGGYLVTTREYVQPGSQISVIIRRKTDNHVIFPSVKVKEDYMLLIFQEEYLLKEMKGALDEDDPGKFQTQSFSLSPYLHQKNPEIFLAYSGIAQSVEFVIEKSEREAVVALYVSQARLVTMSTNRNYTVNFLFLDVVNTGENFLELKLPADSQFWSCFVNDKPSSPLKKEGTLFIPVERSERDGSIKVELVYASPESWGMETGLFKTSKVTMPQYGAPVARIDIIFSGTRGWKRIEEQL